NVRNHDDKWHNGSACAKRQFARGTKREMTAHEIAGESSTQQTAGSRGGVRHPGEHADCFDVKTARIIKIFGEPKQIEKPGRIAQEFGGHQTPGFANKK